MSINEIKDYILDITKDIKNMSINEIKDFVFGNYCKRTGFSRKISYNSMKRLNKKDLLLIANKLIKIYQILVMLKNTINYL